MVFIFLVILLLLLIAALVAVNNINVDEDGETVAASAAAAGPNQAVTVGTGNTRLPWIGIMPEEMRGVPYFLGKIRRKVIRPGFYVRLPLLYVIEGVIVQEQVVNVPRVEVSTRGGSTIGLRVALTIKLPAPNLTLAENRAWLPVVVERVKLELANAFSGLTAERILSTEWQSIATEDATTRQGYLDVRLREVLADLRVNVVKAVVVEVSIPENLQARLSQLDTQHSDSAADSARADHEAVLAEKYLAAARAHFESEGNGDASDEDVRSYAKFLRRLATLEDLNVPLLFEGRDSED